MGAHPPSKAAEFVSGRLSWAFAEALHGKHRQFHGPGRGQNWIHREQYVMIGFPWDWYNLYILNMEDVQVFPVILDRFCMVNPEWWKQHLQQKNWIGPKQVAEQNSLIEI